MTKPTSFAVGRRWLCTPEEKYGVQRARFWFVILGPGHPYNDPEKVSSTHKMCRLEIHPDDLRDMLYGYKSHGSEQNYSHAHLRKVATLEPLPETP